MVTLPIPLNKICGYLPYFSLLNAWLHNQAFQYHNNIKIFLELFFIFQYFLSAALNSVFVVKSFFCLFCDFSPNCLKINDLPRFSRGIMIPGLIAFWLNCLKEPP